MVKIVSKEQENKNLEETFKTLESITQEMFSECIIKRPSHPTLSNKYERTIYTQGITSVPSYYANQVNVSLGPGPFYLRIYDERAHDDALRLAQAYEHTLKREFTLYTP